MKKIRLNLYLLLFIALFSSQAFATAEVCNADGSYCKIVDRVFFEEYWWYACCYNVHIPPGWSCEDDCADDPSGGGVLTKNSTRTPPKSSDVDLTRENSYVLMNNGYRVWILVDDIPITHMDLFFGSEEIREFLPAAQTMFLAESKLEKVRFIYSDNIAFVVGKPENNEDLQKEIIFKDYSAYEAQKEEAMHEFFESKVQVYPTAVTDQMTVEISSSRSIKKISVRDMLGVELYNKEWSEAAKKQVSIQLDFINRNGYLMVEIVDSKGKIYLRKIRVIN